MTSILKAAREAPLLIPAKRDMREKWMNVSPRDEETMRDYLEGCRSSGKGLDVAIMLHYMKMLGIPQQATEDDIKAMRRYIQSERDERTGIHGYSILQMHYFMKNLGINEPMTEQDLKTIDYTLHHFENVGVRGDTRTTLVMHYYMRQLGIPEAIGEKDEQDMRSLLVEESGTRVIAREHATMRALGYETKLLPQDMEAIEDAVTKYREEGTGSALAETLYHLHQLFPPRQPVYKPKEMPLLKRFGGDR